jgi:CO/xanthine dehydrogenase FAD-binding subunit
MDDDLFFEETYMLYHTHPTLPEFEYVHLETLDEASHFLALHPNDSCPFLGGTDIFVHMRNGLVTPKFLVDIKKLSGTNDLLFDKHKGLTIGAAVNMNRVISSAEVRATYPLLVEACRSVASYQLRTRATIIGNICNASPAGDTIGACLALDGVLRIHGISGLREEPLAKFFLGPGKTSLKSGDIVLSIGLPIPPKGCIGTYLKLGRNKLSDLSIVGVTVLASPDPNLKSGIRFRIVLASVAPIPLVASESEAALSAKIITTESIQEAAYLASKASISIDDLRGSARYRKLMVRSLTEMALNEVWKKFTN